MTTWKDFCQKSRYWKQICYKTIKYTVCERVTVHFSAPEILQAGAVKGSPSMIRGTNDYPGDQLPSTARARGTPLSDICKPAFPSLSALIILFYTVSFMCCKGDVHLKAAILLGRWSKRCGFQIALPTACSTEAS